MLRLGAKHGSVEKFLIIAILVAAATADVSEIVRRSGEAAAEILKQDLDVGLEGQYQWAFETENGISARAQGALNNPQGENPSQVAQGEAKWTSPEGEQVQFAYVADENGYQPQGSHIPTSPPIPEAIVRALQYIAAHPPPPEKP